MKKILFTFAAMIVLAACGSEQAATTFEITIIGIPWGKMHFRLAKLALSPFGMEVI